jgi:hypothetical protein
VPPKERRERIMTWSDIVTKLTSRKLWVAIGAIIGVWVSPDVSGTIQAVITGAVAAAYALAEGIADAGRKS